jgi:hypothetical protein
MTGGPNITREFAPGNRRSLPVAKRRPLSDIKPGDRVWCAQWDAALAADRELEEESERSEAAREQRRMMLKAAFDNSQASVTTHDKSWAVTLHGLTDDQVLALAEAAKKIFAGTGEAK